MLALRSLCDNSRTPELMRRYEQGFDMQYHRAMKGLNAIQDKKTAQKKSLCDANPPNPNGISDPPCPKAT